MNPDVWLSALLVVNTGLLGWSLLQSVKNGREIARMKVMLNFLVKDERMRV